MVAFDKEGNRLNGTIARIFSPDKEGNPLRFQFKTREGVLFDHTCDIFTTAQHVLAATIDKANGDDGDADVLAMAAKAKQMALGTTEGPLPNHLTDQMNRQITSTDYDVLQSLESLPENALKYGLVALTSGRQLIFLRFIYKTSVTTLANIEFGMRRAQAHAVSLRLPIDCNGVVISPGLILKWVYFAFDSYSLQDLAPARTSDTSATASTNDDKQAVIFSDGGIPCITSAKAKVKRKEVASVAAVENCLEIMQYLWMQFYDNNFVYAYFAKLRALLTKVKRDFGEDNFAIVKEFITFFVRGERRRLFAHIGAGHTIESFSPFGSPAEVAKMMTNLREISNQHTARVVLNLTGQLAAANSGSQQAGSSRGSRAAPATGAPSTTATPTRRRRARPSAPRARGGVTLTPSPCHHLRSRRRLVLRGTHLGTPIAWTGPPGLASRLFATSSKTSPTVARPEVTQWRASGSPSHRTRAVLSRAPTRTAPRANARRWPRERHRRRDGRRDRRLKLAPHCSQLAPYCQHSLRHR